MIVCNGPEKPGEAGTDGEECGSIPHPNPEQPPKGKGDEMDKEVRISRAKITGLLWTDIVLMGNRVYPVDRHEADAYEEELEREGYTCGERIETEHRVMRVWRRA